MIDYMDQPNLKTTWRIATARAIFVLAAVYGFPVLGYWFYRNPQIVRYAFGQQPEIYDGFASLGLAWQAVFLLIAYDPRRYRPLMLFAAFGEKLFFAGLVTSLLIRHIAQPHWIAPVVIDGTLGVLFIVAFLLTGERRQ